MRRIFEEDTDPTSSEVRADGGNGAGLEPDRPPSVGGWAYPVELGGSAGSAAVDDALPIHRLPEAPREQKGPLSVSLAMHVVIIALVLARASWLAAHFTPPPEPERSILVALQEPQPEPAPAMRPPRTPLVEPVAPPRSPVPEPRRQEFTPPVPQDAPKVPPLPAPTRMGTIVPVPHYPVPGTVPPEEEKTAKGLPGPKEETPPRTPQVDPNGNSDSDPGVGALTGPGSGGTGMAVRPGGGVVPPSSFGNIYVPRQREGRGHKGSGDSEGGGSRRGLDYQLNGTSLGDFTFEDRDYDWNDYYNQMYYLIKDAWYNRLYLTTANFERWSYQHGTRALKGSVLVRFVIERSGAVSSIEVLEPSVMTPLDESARAALKEVILPRLPDDFKKDREAVTGRFIMDVDDVGGFGQELRYLKYLGKF